MHPLIRDLYKRFIFASRVYPGDATAIRVRIQSEFSSVQSEDELMFAINKGRYWVKEMMAIAQMKKYREMNRRYPRTTHSEEDGQFSRHIAQFDDNISAGKNSKN